MPPKLTARPSTINGWEHLAMWPALAFILEKITEILSLPMYPELERDQIEYVCARLLDIQKSSEGVKINA